jgi:hypothetical protein
MARSQLARNVKPGPSTGAALYPESQDPLQVLHAEFFAVCGGVLWASDPLSARHQGPTRPN